MENVYSLDWVQEHRPRLSLGDILINREGTRFRVLNETLSATVSEPLLAKYELIEETDLNQSNRFHYSYTIDNYIVSDPPQNFSIEYYIRDLSSLENTHIRKHFMDYVNEYSANNITNEQDHDASKWIALLEE